MEQWDQVINKAGELYGGNYHCCEAIVLAVSEYLGYQDDSLLKICTPFGGGMIKNGAACGSLIAAYLCMGIFKGRNSTGESRDGACDPANRIFQKFCEKYGSSECRDIIGYDMKDHQVDDSQRKKVKCEVCIPLTKEVTRWILEELDH
jgi:C_GCAxxG_C_C family probable redox protein